MSRTHRAQGPCSLDSPIATDTVVLVNKLRKSTQGKFPGKKELLKVGADQVKGREWSWAQFQTVTKVYFCGCPASPAFFLTARPASP